MIRKTPREARDAVNLINFDCNCADNRRLPFKDKHFVASMGKLTINHVAKEDSGIYKCIISNLNGERAEQAFALTVSGTVLTLCLYS